MLYSDVFPFRLIPLLVVMDMKLYGVKYILISYVDPLIVLYKMQGNSCYRVE